MISSRTHAGRAKDRSRERAITDDVTASVRKYFVICRQEHTAQKRYEPAEAYPIRMRERRAPFLKRKLPQEREVNNTLWWGKNNKSDCFSSGLLFKRLSLGHQIGRKGG